jgi:hypothetical protein
MLRTAILRGHRPTTLILRKQPYSKWKRVDYLLAHAYQIFEDEISRNTGLPVWLTRSLDPNLRLDIEERFDPADRLLADWDAKNSGKDKKRGVSRTVVALNADGKPFEYGGITRQHYREAAIQEERDRIEELEDVEFESDRPEGGYNPAEYGDGLTNPAD